MQRRGFFGGLAILLTAPSVMIRKQKTEKHWVCLSCGEPIEHSDKTGSDSCLNCGAHISCTVWK